MTEDNLIETYQNVREKLGFNLRDFVALRIYDPEGRDLETKVHVGLAPVEEEQRPQLLDKIREMELPITEYERPKLLKELSRFDGYVYVDVTYVDVLELAQQDYVRVNMGIGSALKHMRAAAQYRKERPKSLSEILNRRRLPHLRDDFIIKL